MARNKSSYVPDADDAEHFFQPLALSAEVTIAAKHMLKLKALEVTVGAIASVRGAVGSMGWIVLDPAPEIELIDVDIHSSDTEHQGKAKAKTPRTVDPADGDEADGGDEIEAVADASAMRVSMHGNPMHRRPQALNEAAADASATRTSAAHVAADLVLSPSDKKRRDSHFAAKDKRRLKKRERLDNLKDLAAIADEGANCEEETRAADDGGIYTQTQFIEHYGGTAEWDAAAATSPPLREKVEAEERDAVCARLRERLERMRRGEMRRRRRGGAVLRRGLLSTHPGAHEGKIVGL
jgi:hypothetical protein